MRAPTGEGIAARAGRWSARHRRIAIWAWLGFVIAAFSVGAAVGTTTLRNDQLGVGESGQADRTISAAFPQREAETVLVQSQGTTAADPSFRAAVLDTQRRLQGLPYVGDVRGPYGADNAAQISADGHSALINFQVRGDSNQAQDRVGPALDAVGAAQAAHPSLLIQEFGVASANRQLGTALSSDFHQAEVTSLPVTLLILLIAFGALVAAGVPLLLAFSGVMATIGLVAVISQFAPVDQSINEVVLLIGLAVGVDYSMFYLRRSREERARGRSERTALQIAAATSGRAVLVSGLTVMIAMAGMYLAGDATFQSFATGTILVVAVSLLGSLTVLPAILAWLGDRVDRGRVPLVGRLKRRGVGSGIWSRIVDLVLRRPVVSIAAAGGLLAFLAIPAFSLHTAMPGFESMPQDLGVIKTYHRIQTAFPGGPIPASVVVNAGDPSRGSASAATIGLARQASRDPLFKQPITFDVNPQRTVAVVNIPLAGSGSDAKSNAAVADLRGRLIPATIGRMPGASADVTGYTASSMDFNDSLKSHVLWVFGFVLTAAFLLLLITFRSVVIPLKAIVLNLLSVGAAYGIVVWIFQEGHLQSLLGFQSIGSITAWLPLFLFVVLFGLSMDYHVFILTRVREAYDRGMSTDAAVAHAIKTTAGVVTSAAIVMVAVFGIFATLSVLIFKELGVALGVAVLLDATIVRAVLLPATMKLLGDWNWYLPRWLEWLPRIGTPRADLDDLEFEPSGLAPERPETAEDARKAEPALM